MSWVQSDAVAFCRQLQEVVYPRGFFVALSGGVLYKDGARKDLDVLICRSHARNEVSYAELLGVLIDTFELKIVKLLDWRAKVSYRGELVDLVFVTSNPEHST